MAVESPLRFGLCELDVARRTLRRRGESVAVQPRVFDLLVYLIERRDRVVPSEELLDALWGGVAVTPSSLSRAVYKARLAVGDGGEEQRTIATMRRRGFRFIAPLRQGSREPPAGDSDFVGRDYELGRLDEALDRALEGRGGLVVLTGEPGIGKTRVARKLVTRALGRGAQAMLARCPESSDAPAYWPWRQIARRLARERTPGELVRLAGREAADLARVDPELARGLEPVPELSPEEMRLRLFESAVTVLERLARERPMALALDDLHNADLPSVAFLRFLSHFLSELPILVVATFRDRDIAGDEERRRLLAEAERRAGGERLALEPLEEREVAALAEKRLARPLSAEGLEALCALSGRNPFILGELLRLAAQRGEEILSCRSHGRLGLSATARTAVEVQLHGVGPEERRILGVAAVLGREFAPGLLSKAADATHASVGRALGAALDAHVLEHVEADGARYRFRHALLRDALYADLEATPRALQHLRVARVLEDEPGTDPSELAFHWHQALSVGGAERALHHACQAAQHCRSQLAFEKAAHHLEQALDALTYLPAAPSRRRCELLIEAAQAFAHSDLGRGAQLLLEALRLARELSSAEFGSLLFAISAVAADFRLAPDELRSAVKEALESPSTGDPAAQAMLLAAAGRGCLRGDPSAKELSRRAVALARSSGDASVLARALVSWHWLHWAPENLLPIPTTRRGPTACMAPGRERSRSCSERRGQRVPAPRCLRRGVRGGMPRRSSK